jgi:hypothetical protein
MVFIDAVGVSANPYIALIVAEYNTNGAHSIGLSNGMANSSMIRHYSWYVAKM